MTGLEKILDSLDTEAKTKCDKIISDGEAEAEASSKKIIDDANLTAKKIIEQAQKKADSTVLLAKKAGDMAVRQSELGGKVRLIDKCLADALKYYEDLDEKDYFNVLASLCIANAMTGNGKIHFSPVDFARLPEKFVETVNDEINNKNISLEAVEDKAITEKGVVISYGDVEVNLLFPAIFDSLRDELKSECSRVLLAK